MLNKAQLKAKKKRVEASKIRQRRSIARRFGESDNLPKGMARNMEEFGANGGKLFK
jgi:hypothetical protein